MIFFNVLFSTIISKETSVIQINNLYLKAYPSTVKKN